MNPLRTIGLLLMTLGIAVLALKLGRVYDPTPVVQRLSVKAGPAVAKTVERWQPVRVVYGGLVALPILAGALCLLASSKSKTAAPDQAVAEHKTELVKSSKVSTKKAAAVHSCNVLEIVPEGRKVWQFDARNGGFALNREQISLAGEPLPSKLIGKDWTSLFQRKLNIAWLPPEKVFLRVAQFPQSDFGETLAMVEMQLEKLSPMPVAQIAWTIHVLPHAAGNMQTVIVIVVSRNVVEEFLGQLEGQGYLADSLELPVLDQLRATPINGDGAWIYPEAAGGKNSAVSAWWYGGVLQNLDIVTLPVTNRAAALKEQLMQMAWAGELEGWLTAPPRWHLVSSTSSASEWEPAMREGLEQPIEVLEPRPAPQLAAATAQRAAHADPRANLMPAEFSTRYQQEFVDGLWMRGLFAVAGIYMVGVIIYFIALQVALFRTRSVEAQVAGLSTTYTNALQTKARYQVLKDRSDLKFAALDCWKIVAELMPESLTLSSWNFSDGKRLALNGTAPPSQGREVDGFYEAVRKATVIDGDKRIPMFDLVGRESDYSSRTGPDGTINWSFSLDLKRSEVH
jgi:hypothetical protein